MASRQALCRILHFAARRQCTRQGIAAGPSRLFLGRNLFTCAVRFEGDKDGKRNFDEFTEAAEKEKRSDEEGRKKADEEEEIRNR